MKKSAGPSVLPKPPPRGTEEQHSASAPFHRGAAQDAASSVQEPEGSSWRFFGKQFLDAHASFKMSTACFRAGFYAIYSMRTFEIFANAADEPTVTDPL